MFNKYINFFLLSKKILTKPKEKKILIFDEDDAEIISKYFNKNDIEILPIRMAYKPGQRLNIYILFRTRLFLKNFSRIRHLIRFLVNSLMRDLSHIISCRF